MGLSIHTFPGKSFDVIETTLRAGKFHVARCTGRKRSRLLVRSGLASAFVTDYTEEKESDLRFAVTSGRSGLFIAVICWPLDSQLVRKITQSLEDAGASFLDVSSAV